MHIAYKFSSLNLLYYFAEYDFIKLCFVCCSCAN